MPLLMAHILCAVVHRGHGKLTVHRPLFSLWTALETAEGKAQRRLWRECVPSAFEIRPTQGGLHQNPGQDDGGWASSPHPPFLHGQLPAFPERRAVPWAATACWNQWKPRQRQGRFAGPYVSWPPHSNLSTLFALNVWNWRKARLFALVYVLPEGLQGADGPVIAARLRHLLADQQVLPRPGGKGEGDHPDEQQQENRPHRLPQGGFQKDFLSHSAPHPLTLLYL